MIFDFHKAFIIVSYTVEAYTQTFLQAFRAAMNLLYRAIVFILLHFPSFLFPRLP